MIEVKNLSKTYGSLNAVSDISFSLEDGEILGFLGPNGAGKSTTMNMICGLLVPDEGKIEINGIDLLESPKKAKKHIGYLPENPPLYPEMTVMEYLKFCCELKGIGKKSKEESSRVMYLCGIEHVKNRLIKNLSKGYKQRIGIAAALTGDPAVLILDEPTVGQDHESLKNIIDSLNEIHEKTGNTMITITHDFRCAESFADKIIWMDKGSVYKIGGPELAKEYFQNNMGDAPAQITIF